MALTGKTKVLKAGSSEGRKEEVFAQLCVELQVHGCILRGVLVSRRKVWTWESKKRPSDMLQQREQRRKKSQRCGSQWEEERWFWKENELFPGKKTMVFELQVLGVRWGGESARSSARVERRFQSLVEIHQERRWMETNTEDQNWDLAEHQRAGEDEMEEPLQ